jgi:hypothetical protein
LREKRKKGETVSFRLEGVGRARRAPSLSVCARRRGLLFRSIELAVAITFEMLDIGEETGIRFATIEDGDFMPASGRVSDLMRSGESGSSQDQNAERFGSFCRCLWRNLGGQRCDSGGNCDR